MAEKQRILLIALVLFILFIVVAALDGWFTILVFEQGEGWGKLRFWLVAMGIMLSLIGFSLGFASLLGDPLGWSFEDYFAVVLLTVMPWILILGGFLDVISATIQNYVRGVPLVQGYWESLGFRWPWLDPVFNVWRAHVQLSIQRPPRIRGNRHARRHSWLRLFDCFGDSGVGGLL